MPIATIRLADHTLDLIRRYVPRPVQSDGRFDDWGVLAPAFLWIAGDLLEGVLSATPPRGRIRASIMARSLAEYVVTFAWLAAARTEDRDALIQSLIKDEFASRQKTENKLGQGIALMPRYEHLAEPNGPIPRTMLDQASKDRLATLEADPNIPQLLDALARAFKADERWLDEFEPVRHYPFSWVYVSLFEIGSVMSHPTITAVAKVTAGNPPDLLVGLPESRGRTDTPYSAGLIAMLNMLLVASETLGYPDRQQVDWLYTLID
jgi:hypothetical protein